MIWSVLAAAILYCATARAGPITFQFTGTVSQVPLDEVFGNIAPGNAISGDFTFDSDAVDSVPGNPAIGSYLSPAGLPYIFNVTLAGHSFSASDSLGVGIFNVSVDQYSVLATNNLLSESLGIFLQDNSGTVFAGDGLPLSPPALSAFASSPVAFSLDATFDAGEIQVNGIVDSLSCGACQASPVPEPSSAAPLAVALACCVFPFAQIQKSTRRKCK